MRRFRAHAAVMDWSLLTRDTRHYQRYFQKLKLIAPVIEASRCFDRIHGASAVRWHKEGKCARLIVPTRLSPFECNVLIHPSHKHTLKIHVGDAFPARSPGLATHAKERHPELSSANRPP